MITDTNIIQAFKSISSSIKAYNQGLLLDNNIEGINVNGNLISASITNKILEITSVTGLTYKGLWNANTNSPTLSNGSGSECEFYIVNVAGTTTIDGISSWSVGDWIISNGVVWQKIPDIDVDLKVYSSLTDPYKTNDGVDTASLGTAFSVGDKWINTSDNLIYECLDNTTNSAKWYLTNGNCIYSERFNKHFSDVITPFSKSANSPATITYNTTTQTLDYNSSGPGGNKYAQLFSGRKLNNSRCLYLIKWNHNIPSYFWITSDFATNGYRIQTSANGASTNFVLQRLDAGTPTQLDTAVVTINTGSYYLIEIRKVNNQVSGYLNGVEIVRATDTTYNEGFLYFSVYANGDNETLSLKWVEHWQTNQYQGYLDSY